MTETVHAGCVARLTRHGWAGVLIRGASGAGKSDLTLRLLERGWALVGDDRVQLWNSGGRLYARGPQTLAGFVEARGLGVVGVRRRPLAALRLVVECVGADAELERVPEPSLQTVGGVGLEQVRLRPFEATAPVKVTLALARALDGADAF